MGEGEKEGTHCPGLIRKKKGKAKIHTLSVSIDMSEANHQEGKGWRGKEKGGGEGERGHSISLWRGGGEGAPLSSREWPDSLHKGEGGEKRKGKGDLLHLLSSRSSDLPCGSWQGGGKRGKVCNLAFREEGVYWRPSLLFKTRPLVFREKGHG